MFNKIYFYTSVGICLGFQLAVVEYSRNVLGWEYAHSLEAIKDPEFENLGDVALESRKIVVSYYFLCRKLLSFIKN